MINRPATAQSVRTFRLTSLANFVIVAALVFLMAAGLCAQGEQEQSGKLQEIRSYYETAQRFEHEGNWVEAEKDGAPPSNLPTLMLAPGQTWA